jgi:hypothetical protein
MDDRRIVFQLPAGAGNFSVVQTDSGAHPASYAYTMGTGDRSLEANVTESKAYHSPPSNAKVKNA